MCFLPFGILVEFFVVVGNTMMSGTYWRAVIEKKRANVLNGKTVKKRNKCSLKKERKGKKINEPTKRHLQNIYIFLAINIR